MVRTQIQLTEEQADSLRKIAAARRLSLAEVIRQSLELYLADANRCPDARIRERALEVIGKYSSGLSDISSDHDRYLEDAYRA